jgi:hypothetical protein
MIHNKTKAAKTLLEAVEKGYTVVEGKIFHNGKQLKGNHPKSGYIKFNMRTKDGKTNQVNIHRLVAYQKYGDKIFLKGIHVRHLDSNSTNNLEENIAIGTKSENELDKPAEVRMRAALIASSFSKKHDHEAIVKLYNDGNSYNKIMELLNIKSKGTISFIINKSIEVRKGGIEPPKDIVLQTTAIPTQLLPHIKHRVQ